MQLPATDTLSRLAELRIPVVRGRVSTRQPMHGCPAASGPTARLREGSRREKMWPPPSVCREARHVRHLALDLGKWGRLQFFCVRHTSCIVAICVHSSSLCLPHQLPRPYLPGAQARQAPNSSQPWSRGLMRALQERKPTFQRLLSCGCPQGTSAHFSLLSDSKLKPTQFPFPVQ